MLIIIACGLGVVILNENTSPAGEAPAGSPYEVRPALTEESEDYKTVYEFFHSSGDVAEVQDRRYEDITIINPFDRVRFLPQEQIDRLVREKIQQARLQRNTGDFSGAIETCKQILQMEDREEARQIIEFCREKLKAE
ncbi:hypothetical protein JXA32_00635 [Candidatus Sumerlaeota bacterium]|nr:hypothetical protein [Candidatus Sumerlaeota bacterium]